jgi:Mrp family chromosome partitioning ATPase
LSSAQSALAAYLQTHPNNPDNAEQTRLTNEVAAAQTQRDQAVDHYNQAQIAGATGAVDPTAFHVIDPPKVPTAATSRKKQLVMTGLGSLLGGGVITLLILVLLVAADRSVREEQDLEGVVEVAGTVPQFAKGVLASIRRRPTREPQEGFWVPESLLEACRAVTRHIGRGERYARSKDIAVGSSPARLVAGISEGRLQGRSVPMSPPPSGPAPRIIGVTSSLRGEGRTTIAAGIAAAAHEARGLRTILVELDFEGPSLARKFGIVPVPGVAEVLRGEATLEGCLNVPANGSVAVLVAGNAQRDGAELFGALQQSSLMKDLTQLGDEIIADLPACSSMPESRWLAEEFSTVVLVVRSGMAPMGQIRRVLDDLEIMPSAVLNGVSSSIPRPIRTLLEG